MKEVKKWISENFLFLLAFSGIVGVVVDPLFREMFWKILSIIVGLFVIGSVVIPWWAVPLLVSMMVILDALDILLQ